MKKKRIYKKIRGKDKRLNNRKNGIRLTKRAFYISVNTEEFLIKEEGSKWERLDIMFDFKNNFMILQRNDKEGRVKVQTNTHGGYWQITATGVPPAAKRGRYFFLKKQGGMYFFKLSTKE